MQHIVNTRFLGISSMENISYFLVELDATAKTNVLGKSHFLKDCCQADVLSTRQISDSLILVAFILGMGSLNFCGCLFFNLIGSLRRTFKHFLETKPNPFGSFDPFDVIRSCLTLGALDASSVAFGLNAKLL